MIKKQNEKKEQEEKVKINSEAVAKEQVELDSGVLPEKKFDFNAMKVPPDRKHNVTPQLNTIIVGKQNKKDFFRVRDGDGWEPVELFLYSPGGNGTDNTPYLVMPVCQELLEEMGQLTSAKFYLTQTYGSGVMKVDYISTKLNANGSRSRYHESRMEIYELAKTRYLRMHADKEAGFYMCAFAEDTLPWLPWPIKPENLQEAIEIAFKGFVLDSLDHPEMKKLRGKL
jgi:hypothetical protein